MSELILKEIIKLKNQKVYLIENAEGVFFVSYKRDTKILSETCMLKLSIIYCYL